MAKTRSKKSKIWPTTTILGAVLAGSLTATTALGQALPVAGFAPADADSILNAGPFAGALFSPQSLGGGDGTAEAILKDLITSIRTDPRFVPALRPGAIFEGAVLRPPPDSILWPGAEPEATAPPLGDPNRWILDTRPEATLHRTNARMLAAIGPWALEQSGTGFSFVSLLTSPGIASPSQSQAFTPSGPFLANLGDLTAGCRPGPQCTAIDRALRWAGRDFIADQTPIQVKIGQAILDAASVGAFASTPAQRLATMAVRADQRRQVGVTTESPADGLPDQNRYRIEPVETLPWEISAVIGAVVLEMRKFEEAGPVWPVAIDDGAAQALKEPDFRYQEFDLSAVAVTWYQQAFSGALDLGAILTFVNGDGRRGIVSAALSFIITGEGIQVTSADLALMAAPTIRVRIVIAPGGVYTNANFSGRLNAAVENEVTPRTAESFFQEFEVQAFFLDRMPPDARVEIRLGTDAAGTAGFGVGTSADFDGWRVAHMNGAFALNGPSEFFIKALVQPGGPVPGFDRVPVLAGVVSSHGDERPSRENVLMPPSSDRTFPNLVVAP
jgi:hypothetical protein